MDPKIKNIIFDFGGVIIPIDTMAFAMEMQRMGCRDIKALHESLLAENVYMKFEKGQMETVDFRNRLRQGLDDQVSDERLDHAWNLIIGEIPPYRVEFLEQLGSTHRIFLLSNTNKIHYDYYQAQFSKSFNYPSLDSLFEKAYYSFKIGLYKPDPAIFEFVMKDSGLIPEETIFIDDYKINVEAAAQCGLKAIHLDEGMEVSELGSGDRINNISI